MITDFTFYGGKFEGVKLSDMTTPARLDYLRWYVKNARMKPHKEVLIKKHLEGR